MDVKIIKRILFGILAVVFLALGGRELWASGVTSTSIAAGAAGLVFLLSAVTGVG